MPSRPSQVSRVGVAAVTIGLAAAGLTGCGSHDAAAPATVPASSSSSSSSASSSTTAPVRHLVSARHKVKARPAPSVAPLTGLPTTAKIAKQPAVVLKVDNVQAALPQTGINQADVVYEEMVEGGLTRLAVVFQSRQPAVVGPVRSGRLTDEGIADDLNHPVLAYAGTNGIFQPLLAAQPLDDVTMASHPALFVRNNNQVAPHNLYTTIKGLAATDVPSNPPPPLFAYHRRGAALTGADVRPAGAVSISFPAAAISWTWSAKQDMWLRTQNGAADITAEGTQISAANVVIEWIPYVTTAIVSGEGANADGTPIPGGKMVGHGTAWILSGGRIVKGTWSRKSITAVTVYKDSKGHVIRLEPGRTWVELPQNGAAAAVTP